MFWIRIYHEGIFLWVTICITELGPCSLDTTLSSTTCGTAAEQVHIRNLCMTAVDSPGPPHQA